MSTATITFPSIDPCAIGCSPEQFMASPILVKQPQKFIVRFSEISVEHATFKLQSPLEMILEECAGGWSCEEPIFSLFAFAETGTLAVCSCFEDFAVLWDEIAQADDEILSGDAQRVKQKLLSIVKSVKMS